MGRRWLHRAGWVPENISIDAEVATRGTSPKVVSSVCDAEETGSHYRNGQAENNKDGEGRCRMGDKGGKKDKTKDRKQKAIKQREEAKRKLDKQPKRKS